MDWQPLGIAVVGVLSLAALGQTAARDRVTRRRVAVADVRARDAEVHATLALQAAEQSAAAGARAAAAAERMAKTLERQALQAERSSSAPGVTWTLEHAQGQAYLLTNAGRAAAYDVQIRLDAAIRTMGELHHDELQPAAAVKFIAVVAPDSTDDTVTVTWKGRTLVEHSWSRPLPPKAG
jgi:hypothetical protein